MTDTKDTPTNKDTPPKEDEIQKEEKEKENEKEEKEKEKETEKDTDKDDEQAAKRQKGASGEPRKPPQFMKKQERVRIKVGTGELQKQFSTTRQTLHVFPDAKIAKMFTIGDGLELEKDEEGFYLLPDRQPEGFRYCLNFLRDKDTTVPTNDELRGMMESEARYYGINELVTKLTETKKTAKKPTIIFTDTKQFDGKDKGVEWQKLDVNHSSSWSLTFKMSFDKKPTKTNKMWVVFHKGGSKEEQTPSLFLTCDKILTLHLNNAGDAIIQSNALEPKTDYTVACVFDTKAKTANLYIDGKPVAAKLPDDWAVSEGPLNIAASESIGKKQSFIGNMTNFTCHYSALSQSGVTETFNSA